MTLPIPATMRIRFELYPDNVYPYLVPPLRQCLTLHAACTPGGDTPVNGSSSGSQAGGDWTEVSDYFSFLALPVVVSFAVATQLASLVVLWRLPARASLETYLLGLGVASLLLLAASSLLAAQHYVGRYDLIVRAQPYAFSCRDWFWYTALWLIVMMAFERALAVSSSRASVLCTPPQAGVVVVMVFCVGLVSALPRFWEYDTAMHFDRGLNVSALAATKTSSTATAEYNTMYFWYVKTLTLFLPYLMMLVTGVTLCLRSRGEALARRYTVAVKHASAAALGRRMKEETAQSRLLVMLMALYVLFSTPCCLLELLARVAPHLLDPDSRLFAALHNLFTVLFFLHYALHLILYFCYNRQFRLTLLEVCCCCC